MQKLKDTRTVLIENGRLREELPRARHCQTSRLLEDDRGSGDRDRAVTAYWQSTNEYYQIEIGLRGYQKYTYVRSR